MLFEGRREMGVVQSAFLHHIVRMYLLDREDEVGARECRVAQPLPPDRTELFVPMNKLIFVTAKLDSYHKATDKAVESILTRKDGGTDIGIGAVANRYRKGHAARVLSEYIGTFGSEHVPDGTPEFNWNTDFERMMFETNGKGLSLPEQSDEQIG